MIEQIEYVQDATNRHAQQPGKKTVVELHGGDVLEAEERPEHTSRVDGFNLNHTDNVASHARGGAGIRGQVIFSIPRNFSLR